MVRPSQTARPTRGREGLASEDPLARLAALFAEHGTRLERLAAPLLRGSGATPEDVVGDIVLRYAQGLAGHAPPEGESDHLSRMVREHCLDLERRAARCAPAAQAGVRADAVAARTSWSPLARALVMGAACVAAIAPALSHDLAPAERASASAPSAIAGRAAPAPAPPSRTDPVPRPVEPVDAAPAPAVPAVGRDRIGARRAPAADTGRDARAPAAVVVTPRRRAAVVRIQEPRRKDAARAGRQAAEEDVGPPAAPPVAPAASEPPPPAAPEQQLAAAPDPASVVEGTGDRGAPTENASGPPPLDMQPKPGGAKEPELGSAGHGGDPGTDDPGYVPEEDPVEGDPKPDTDAGQTSMSSIR